MSRLKTIIGVLILFTYLCPFVSCNKEMAVEETSSVSSSGPASGSDSVNKADSATADTANKSLKPQNTKNEFWQKLFFPTDDSISGLGEVCSFDDNETARFLLVSFLLSIVILLPIKTHYRIGRILIAAINLACVIAFMYFTAIVEKERLLWGIWLLLALVTIQLILEIKHTPVAPVNNAEG